MLINVDKLWKPASQPPTKSGGYLCTVVDEGKEPTLHLGHYSPYDLEKPWVAGRVGIGTVTHWMSIPPLPNTNSSITIPSEVILEEDELGVVVVKPPGDEEGVDVAVLIRVSNEDVMVTLTPAESEQATDLGTRYTTFLQAKQELEQEEELYKDERPTLTN